MKDEGIFVLKILPDSFDEENTVRERISVGDPSMSLGSKTSGLAITEECYRRLFQDLPDMVCITTPSGDLLEVNQIGVETLGYSDRTEILAIPVDRHYANSNDRRRLTSLLKKRGSVIDFPTWFMRKDGKEIYVWITARARKNKRGQVLYYEKIIKDMTIRNRLEEELLDKNRLLERYYQELKRERDQIEDQAGVLAKTVVELEEAKRIVEEQHRKITIELDVAEKLQRSLLPKRYPRGDGFHLASKYLPSNRIGGDFFDIVELNGDEIGVVIADVSGHGPAAALLTTMFKMSFQMYAQDLLSPSSVLTKLNSEFCRLITTGEYITAFYLILNTKEKRILYSKAGHPYPILYRKKTKTHELLDAEGFFIGMFDEAVFEDMEISLDHGDRLLLYTDGIIEARNPAGSCFEVRQLERILAEHVDLSGDALVEKIYDRLAAFTEKDRFEDDLCMVLLSIGA